MKVGIINTNFMVWIIEEFFFIQLCWYNYKYEILLLFNLIVTLNSNRTVALPGISIPINTKIPNPKTFYIIPGLLWKGWRQEIGTTNTCFSFSL